MKRMKQSALTVLMIPLAIVVVAAVIAVALASARKAPERRETTSPGPLVEAVPAHLIDHPVEVVGHGTVQAGVTVQVVPQVSGRVVASHPGLVPGGLVGPGEPLLVIDSADYELARRRAEAVLTRAEVALQMELAEAEVARREWARLNPGEEPTSPLVLREPQVGQARAELESARADLAGAELALERTTVTVPIRARVLEESVDVGQHLVAGQPVATVYGTDVLEIVVPLDDAELAWFDLPDRDGRGALAEIRADFAGAEHSWKGRVVRTEGRVDPVSRMVQVVVAVKETRSTGGRPVTLVPGMFVGVRILGEQLEGVVAVPRHAVRDGSRIWVVDADGRLRIRTVEIAHLEQGRAFISAGLAEGDLVVISQLDVVTDGMLVRVADAGEPEPTRQGETA